jgi:sensor c-di-GMP phosphodiesterase-like protein
MKISASPRTLASLLHIGGIVLVCAGAGLTIGLGVTIHSTEGRLDHYAAHLLQFAEAYNAEINTTLDAVNASPFPLCSDEDIARLRTLVFRGHLVKDIGRVRNGALYCSSTMGRVADPSSNGVPADIVTPSGRSIWLNRPLLSFPGMRGDITQSGEANFVAANDAFGHLREAPMTYTTTLTNRITGKVLRTAGEPLRMTNAEILGEKERIRRGVLYQSRCSAKFAPCMVVGISLREAAKANASQIGGFVLLGGLAGLALGLTLSLPRKRSLVTQLRRALRRNLITVVYQPIVDVKTGRIVGAEALARWTDEDGQYIRPDVFVAAAEELGFIGKLTRVVLRLICNELGPFLRENPGFHVNVNIAAADLADAQFLPMLEKLLKKHRIRSQSIGLELTERSTADHHLAISAIGKLRARGHAFYIDDFGTGYSSLSYLNQLSVDAIKIDRAFTDAVGTGSLTAVIVPQILAMAQALDVIVVVEGVERADQSEYFANLDQEILAQGWHFGEPVPAQALLTLMESKAAEREPA